MVQSQLLKRCVSLQNIKMFPDAHPGKGREIIMLGHLTFSGKSAYDQIVDDFGEAREMLLKVANGDVAATAEEKLKARAMVCHILHYYDRNYVAALKGYNQVIREQTSRGLDEDTAKTRMQIAAASYELAKATSYNRADLQRRIENLWKEASLLQDDYLTSNSQSAQNIRIYTLRVGLMLSEVLIEQDRWDEALIVADSITKGYSEYNECLPFVAESWCHKAHIGVKINNKQLWEQSVDEAIRICESIKTKVWGSDDRDPYWKAYAWKNVGSYHFKEPQKTKERIKAEMIKKFPDHAGLAVYFGEDFTNE